MDEEVHRNLLWKQFNEDDKEANPSRYSVACWIKEEQGRDFDEISQGTIGKYFSNAQAQTGAPSSSESSKYVKKRILKKERKARPKKVFSEDIFRIEKSVHTTRADMTIWPNAVMPEQFDCINFMANIDNISDMLLSNKISISHLDPNVES